MISQKTKFMKTRIIMSLLGLCLSFGALLASTSPLPGKLLLQTHQSDDGKMMIRLTNLQTERTTITLQNLAEGENYFRTIVKDHNGYVAQLVLDKAPNGRYLLKVQQKETTLTQVVVKEDDLILFSQVSKE